MNIPHRNVFTVIMMAKTTGRSSLPVSLHPAYLWPTVGDESLAKTTQPPKELDRVKAALKRFRGFLADSIPSLRVTLHTPDSDKAALFCCGVYVLFYPTGEVARVGEAVSFYSR